MGNTAILLKSLVMMYSVQMERSILRCRTFWKMQIRNIQGFDATRLQRLKPELVVVGNAISRGNNELEWLLDTRAYPIFHYLNYSMISYLRKRYGHYYRYAW